MSELRRDPTTGRWVIIAPERNKRPGGERPAPKRIPGAASFDPACPFCPGDEAMLPAIIAETASIERPGWRIRVVANKFPAVSQNAARREHGAFFEVEPARGHHEVVIESPRHDDDLTTISQDDVRNVLAVYRSRYDALMADAAVRSVIVFRNRGTTAGASLQHPHSQIVALERVPPLVRARQTAMENYYRERGRCVLCDVIANEKINGSRIVNENDAFVTLAPFAAAAPCEMWLLPKRHQADFSEIQEAEIDLFAVALQDALVRLEAALGGPPYNYLFDTAAKGGLGSPCLHWRLRIVPQSIISAGFELASGLPINSHSPEHDAAVLRSFGRASRKTKI
jgi:UDPglucose--hexose-1-phosphate uridylyltransferase